MTFVCGKVGFRDEAAILTAFGDKFQALPPGLKQDCTTCSAAGCTVANLLDNEWDRDKPQFQVSVLLVASSSGAQGTAFQESARAGPDVACIGSLNQS